MRHSRLLINFKSPPRSFSSACVSTVLPVMMTGVQSHSGGPSAAPAVSNVSQKKKPVGSHKEAFFFHLNELKFTHGSLVCAVVVTQSNPLK